MKISAIIGSIVTFDPSDWTITFRVPFVIDGTTFQDHYPKAIPIFHHTYELHQGDEVYIFKNNVAPDTDFYYLPVTLHKFVGIKNKFNFIDITMEGLTDVETQNLFIHSDLKEEKTNHIVSISETNEISTSSLKLVIPNKVDKYFSDGNSLRLVERVKTETTGSINIDLYGFRKTNIVNNTPKSYGDWTYVIGNTFKNISGNEHNYISGNVVETVDKMVIEKYGPHDYVSTQQDEFISNHKYIQTGLGAIFLNSQSNDVQIQANKKVNIIGNKIQEMCNYLYTVVNGSPYPTVNGEVRFNFMDWSMLPVMARMIFTNGRLTSVGYAQGVSGGAGGTWGGTINEKDIDPSIPLGKSGDCTHASCWNGRNAEERMMNILSPRMNNGTFNDRVGFMKGRGVNCVHVFVSNEGDGECSGYSIYGPSFSWNINSSYCSTMLSRIKTLRDNGWKVILWLAADDSGGYNAEIAKNPDKYFSDLSEQGFFKYATTVCIGLEVNEYWGSSVDSLIQRLRKYYPRCIGVHTGSWEVTDGFGSADILFLQTEPGSSDSVIREAVTKTASAYPGRGVNMFELERHADRGKCEVALAAGAFGVGNW